MSSREAAEEISTIKFFGTQDWLAQATTIIDKHCAPQWKPIESAPKDRPVIVGLVKDGRVWRVSDAKHNGLGWYSLHGGQSCHWATHFIELPDAPTQPPKQ